MVSLKVLLLEHKLSFGSGRKLGILFGRVLAGPPSPILCNWLPKKHKQKPKCKQTKICGYSIVEKPEFSMKCQARFQNNTRHVLNDSIGQ